MRSVRGGRYPQKKPHSLSRIDCSSFTTPTTLEAIGGVVDASGLLRASKIDFSTRKQSIFFKPCQRRPPTPLLWVTGRHPRAPLGGGVNVLTVLVTERVSYLATATESP